MGAIGKFFNKEFRTDKFFLECETISDFYLACWQKNRSAVPLLCLRFILFIGCISILIASMALTFVEMGVGLWFIYMTHWGLILITLTSGFAFAISLVAYWEGSIDGSSGLPWYVKTYWVLHNIALPNAFFITVFYWALLAGLEMDFSIDPTLDVFIHAINSVLMFVLLLTSRHQLNLLHVYHCMLYGLVYILFSLIYYYAGGVDMMGNQFIYPMIDWSKPGETVLMVVLSAIFFIILHALVVFIAVARNAITKQARKASRSLSVANADY